MSIEKVRRADDIEEARIRAVQKAIGALFNASELTKAMVWNVLVNMLCGMTIEFDIDKDDLMDTVSNVYDMQALHMVELDTDKPN
jgi:hypothetical protein